MSSCLLPRDQIVCQMLIADSGHKQLAKKAAVYVSAFSNTLKMASMLSKHRVWICEPLMPSRLTFPMEIFLAPTQDSIRSNQWASHSIPAHHNDTTTTTTLPASAVSLCTHQPRTPGTHTTWQTGTLRLSSLPPSKCFPSTLPQRLARSSSSTNGATRMSRSGISP